MDRLSFPLLSLLVVLVVFASSSSQSLSLTLDPSFRYHSSSSSSLSCDASLGGHCDFGSEFLVDSEVNRRILAGTSSYISYGALSANRVPCSSAGRSYYNCRGSGTANPYTRGCTKITGCARDTS